MKDERQRVRVGVLVGLVLLSALCLLCWTALYRAPSGSDRAPGVVPRGAGEVDGALQPKAAAQGERIRVGESRVGDLSGESAEVEGLLRPAGSGLYRPSLGDVAHRAGLVLVTCSAPEVQADSVGRLYVEATSAGSRGPPYPIPISFGAGQLAFFAPQSASEGQVDVDGVGVFRVKWSSSGDSAGIGVCDSVSPPARVGGVHGSVVGLSGEPQGVEVLSCEGTSVLDEDGQFFFETEAGSCDVQVCGVQGRAECCGTVTQLSVEGGDDTIVELSAPVVGQCEPRSLGAQPWSCASGGDLFRLMSAKVEGLVEPAQAGSARAPNTPSLAGLPTKMWESMFPDCTVQQRDAARPRVQE